MSARERRIGAIVGALVAGLTCAIGAMSVRAAVIDTNLNFAAVNQNLWGAGTAIVSDQTIAIPDPNIHVDNLSPGTFSDPTSTLAHFLGIDVGVQIAPTASFSAGLNASFHVNSGSFDVNYPATVKLTLPDQIQAGQSFSVSAAPPGPITLSDKLAVSPGVFAALGGAGYASPLLQRSLVSSVSGLLDPTAAFSTQFPYAEAKVNLDLAASGGVQARFCVVLCASKTFNFGSVDLSQQIIELNSLSGIKVLDQPVVSFNQALDLAQGVSITFSSPNINLDASLPQNHAPLAPLSKTGQQDFLGFSFNVDQLLPLVGAILQSNVGPIGYDLLSVTPTVSLGLTQSLEFDPNAMYVNLQFSAPVLDSRDGRVKTNVLIPVDGSGVTLTPATIGGGLTSTMQVKPTYLLDSMVHNTTTLTLDGQVDIAALALTTPSLGPFWTTDPPIDLGSIPLVDLVDNSWPSEISAITSQKQAIPFLGGVLQQFAVNVGGVDTGGTFYNLFNGATLLATHVYGESFSVPVSGFSSFGCNLDELAIPCDTMFLADEDVFAVDPNDPNNPTDLGRLFCIYCIDRPDDLYAATSPFLQDAADNPLLYLTDLSSFPDFPTQDQLVDPSSAYYDSQLAQTQYFQTLATTAPEIINGSAPEPGTMWLLAVGLLGAVGTRRRLKSLAST